MKIIIENWIWTPEERERDGWMESKVSWSCNKRNGCCTTSRASSPDFEVVKVQVPSLPCWHCFVGSGFLYRYIHVNEEAFDTEDWNTERCWENQVSIGIYSSGCATFTVKSVKRTPMCEFGFRVQGPNNGYRGQITGLLVQIVGPYNCCRNLPQNSSSESSFKMVRRKVASDLSYPSRLTKGERFPTRLGALRLLLTLALFCRMSGNVCSSAALSPERAFGNHGDESQGERVKMMSFGWWLDRIVLIHILGQKVPLNPL